MAYDLQQLITFVAVVEAGTLGRAAAALNVTQPALSRTIRRLEEDVGAPLFERHSKGMHLTDIGSALLPHAKSLRGQAQQAREEVDAMRGLARGTIRVGCVGSIACNVLPQAINSVLGKWPNLSVQVTEGVWDRLSHALLTYEIDLALGVATSDSEEILAIKDCRWDDCSYIVAALDHPLRMKSPLTLADTLDERWTLPPRGTAPYEHISSVFALHSMRMPQVDVETRSVTVLKSLVMRCGFLCWMPESMYLAEQKADLIDRLPIPDVGARRTLTAFRRREGFLPGPIVKLLDQLRSQTSAG